MFIEPDLSNSQARDSGQYLYLYFQLFFACGLEEAISEAI